MSDWLLPPDFPDDISGYAGFVYEVTNTRTRRSYIGYKQFQAKRHKKLVESNWRSYWSSCSELLVDIKVYGKDAFERRILSVHRTLTVLKYEEVAEQIRRDVLRARLPDGSRAFYNGNIAGRYYLRHFDQWSK